MGLQTESSTGPIFVSLSLSLLSLFCLSRRVPYKAFPGPSSLPTSLPRPYRTSSQSSAGCCTPTQRRPPDGRGRRQPTSRSTEHHRAQHQGGIRTSWPTASGGSPRGWCPPGWTARPTLSSSPPGRKRLGVEEEGPRAEECWRPWYQCVLVLTVTGMEMLMEA